jgi:threonylcarbamoyladenosine tRNA methylthiotransferase MtaB
VLTGINIGDFDGEGKLADLVYAVDALKGLKRLRVSSIDPDEVDDALADAILSGKTTCNSMHLVLQSGSNVILKRMNRKYTRQQFFDAVRKLQARDPDFTVTTDIIVGFPGETESDFEETLDVMRQVKFAKVHMFPYSERPRTRAALFPNKVAQDVIQRRKSILLKLAEETSYELRNSYVGRTMSVLTEALDGTVATGHTTNFLPVLLPNDPIEANSLVEVTFIENSPKGLIGKVVSK